MRKKEIIKKRKSKLLVAKAKKCNRVDCLPLWKLIRAKSFVTVFIINMSHLFI
jgi:ribosomal protein L39E